MIFRTFFLLSTARWSRWSDGSSDTVGSPADEASPDLIEIEVPEGEHVSFVIGNSGCFVESLTFVDSFGRKIGKCKVSGKKRTNLTNQRSCSSQWR